ncbi:DUF4129 domain-containing protein [Oceanibium sediminis]|uniref:DUF4129 domain-containing protein n=1 Tax=Oceanibium sediminis TaxID=2026339 RepID=UPI000DD40DCC|nr:DUF4129 domain-containing protein [Oceanibium sediminis]
MRQSIRTAAILACGLLLGTAAAAPAQDTPAPRITPHEVTRNPDYMDALMLRRVQADITYIAELEGELPLDGLPLEPPPEPADDVRDVDAQADLLGRIVVFGGLAALALLLFSKRAALGHLLGGGRARPDQARSAGKQVDAPEESTPTGLLTRLSRAKNREAALVELLEAVLSAAARANGLRVGRSETARELLRRLPRDWPHLGGLRTIVMTEELVQFGGRPLAPEAFRTCLHEAHPILRATGEA